MRICAFSIKKYRSITKAYKVQLNDKSIFIGPNNEGKSNILHGLVLSLRTLNRVAYRRHNRKRLMPNRYRSTMYDPELYDYDWRRDFPVPLQDKQPHGSSEFVLEFVLTKEDRKDFRKDTKINLSSDLKLKLNFFNDGGYTYDVLMPGRAKKPLEQQYEQISRFLRTHINFQYIPAVRTTEYTINIVEQLLASELAILEEDDKYKKLLSDIERMQKPILNELSSKITKSISEFIPDVKKVSINTNRLRRAIRQSCNVLIDDGIETDLEQKGDGIKSLTAISLVRHSSEKISKRKDLILAIEEPESHLHPRAIHRLSTVLSEISTVQQVILTTHSPLLADKVTLANNVLVNKSKARVARNIKEIRDILGVQVSDNLSTANWVLLVEGDVDKKILYTWIIAMSPELGHAFKTGKIIIDDLNGGTNLSYKLAQYKSLLCNTYVYLDDDTCGRASFDKAETKGLIGYDDVTFSICRGRRWSELEDLIEPTVYVDAIKEKFGVSLQGSSFANTKKKWSDRVADIFRSKGKPWSEKIEMKVKNIVSDCVVSGDGVSLKPAHASSVKSLFDALKEKMSL